MNLLTLIDPLHGSTLLPIMWDRGTVVAHMAKANPQWKTITPDSPALLICSGPEAYISPSWYAAKAEHGRPAAGCVAAGSSSTRRPSRS